MLRKGLIVLAMIAPSPLLAKELWCMPDTICRSSGACHGTTDTEASVRLQDMEAAATSLRSHAEDVPMARTHSGVVVQWQGVNEAGSDEILAWRPADGAFVYLIRSDGKERRATGLCEVQ